MGGEGSLFVPFFVLLEIFRVFQWKTVRGTGELGRGGWKGKHDPAELKYFQLQYYPKIIPVPRFRAFQPLPAPTCLCLWNAECSFQVFTGKLFAEITTFGHVPAIPAALPGLGAGTAPGRWGIRKPGSSEWVLEVGFGVKTSWNSSTISRYIRSFQWRSLAWERWFEGCLEILQEFISHFPYGKKILKTSLEAAGSGAHLDVPRVFLLYFLLKSGFGGLGEMAHLRSCWWGLQSGKGKEWTDHVISREGISKSRLRHGSRSIRKKFLVIWFSPLWIEQSQGCHFLPRLR